MDNEKGRPRCFLNPLPKGRRILDSYRKNLNCALFCCAQSVTAFCGGSSAHRAIVGSIVGERQELWELTKNNHAADPTRKAGQQQSDERRATGKGHNFEFHLNSGLIYTRFALRARRFSSGPRHVPTPRKTASLHSLGCAEAHPYNGAARFAANRSKDRPLLSGCSTQSPDQNW